MRPRKRLKVDLNFVALRKLQPNQANKSVKRFVKIICSLNVEAHITVFRHRVDNLHGQAKAHETSSSTQVVVDPVSAYASLSYHQSWCALRYKPVTHTQDVVFGPLLKADGIQEWTTHARDVI